MRIAITGHRGLPADTEQLVDQAIREQLARAGQDITGVSNLADGADQLFAQAVLDAGGQLEVIIPAALYRDGLPESAHASYDRLLSKASNVHQLDRIESTAEAHMEASNVMLDTADRGGQEVGGGDQGARAEWLRAGSEVHDHQAHVRVLVSVRLPVW
jgi:hypothetical protein